MVSHTISVDFAITTATSVSSTKSNQQDLTWHRLPRTMNTKTRTISSTLNRFFAVARWSAHRPEFRSIAFTWRPKLDDADTIASIRHSNNIFNLFWTIRSSADVHRLRRLDASRSHALICTNMFFAFCVLSWNAQHLCEMCIFAAVCRIANAMDAVWMCVRTANI